MKTGGKKPEKALGAWRTDIKEVLEVAHRHRPLPTPQKEETIPTYAYKVSAVIILTIIASGWIGLVWCKPRPSPFNNEPQNSGGQIVALESRVLVTAPPQTIVIPNPTNFKGGILAPTGWDTNIDKEKTLGISRRGTTILIQLITSEETKQSMTNKICRLIKTKERHLAWIQPSIVEKGRNRWVHFEAMTVEENPNHYDVYVLCRPPRSFQIIAKSPRENMEEDNPIIENLVASIQ